MHFKICVLFTAVCFIATMANPVYGKHRILPSLAAAASARFTPEKRELLKSNFPYNYTVEWFTQTVDHFNFAKIMTYQQRYLVSTQFWNKGNPNSPIFFYTGNEGDIELFAMNTGFLWESAEKFKALVVFAEHRYYGQSMPFGNNSFDLGNNVSYLTSEQALADFAVLITSLKKSMNIENAPVVAFGGSYGGMLTAWFRLKYPNIVVGGIAASAPILQFQDVTPAGVFNVIATNDFKGADPLCSDTIRKGFDAIDKLLTTQEGREQIATQFNLCSPLKEKDSNTFIGWIEAAFTYMAMVDYPYPANFLEPLPAWPVNYTCDAVVGVFNGTGDSVQSVIAAMRVYYNYTGTTACFDIGSQATPDLGTLGWDYQSCTEMVMPMSSDGIHDMFPPAPWDLAAFEAYCLARWAVVPRPNWVITYYGGAKVSGGSNIVFSNGHLDPWSGGSVTQAPSSAVIVVNIQEGAHHLDLRSSDPADPQSVIDARKIEQDAISEWINS